MSYKEAPSCSPKRVEAIATLRSAKKFEYVCLFAYLFRLPMQNGDIHF